MPIMLHSNTAAHVVILAPRKNRGAPFMGFTYDEDEGQKVQSYGSAPNPKSRIISVTFGQPKLAPIRDFISRLRSCPSGKYPSWKMGRMMHWESIGERTLLDCDPSITAFMGESVGFPKTNP